MKDYEIAAEKLATLCTETGLTVSWEFVPFSQSRNKDSDSPSLNWRACVTLRGRPIAGLESVDYMQGCGHAPAHKGKAWQDNRFLKARAVALECETGRIAKRELGGHREPCASRNPIPQPSTVDLLSSLAMDSSAIDHATYESWADDFGYDVDSRKGESIYRACLSIALALRAALGESTMADIRDLAGEL